MSIDAPGNASECITQGGERGGRGGTQPSTLVSQCIFQHFACRLRSERRVQRLASACCPPSTAAAGPPVPSSPTISSTAIPAGWGHGPPLTCRVPEGPGLAGPPAVSTRDSAPLRGRDTMRPGGQMCRAKPLIWAARAPRISESATGRPANQRSAAQGKAGRGGAKGQCICCGRLAGCRGSLLAGRQAGSQAVRQSGGLQDEPAEGVGGPY
jgi:hypothetical protein